MIFSISLFLIGCWYVFGMECASGKFIWFMVGVAMVSVSRWMLGWIGLNCGVDGSLKEEVVLGAWFCCGVVGCWFPSLFSNDFHWQLFRIGN